ncbi:Uncharacterised protein [Serratia plymuthica]|uniref:Uncharacterized protein n=1 Tax=Serratia plymuthica TaxID=82996 RepID=A0A2X4X1I9_SERPL|nr:Uncharacterised protein [Serratia plymuthica]
MRSRMNVVSVAKAVLQVQVASVVAVVVRSTANVVKVPAPVHRVVLSVSVAKAVLLLQLANVVATPAVTVNARRVVMMPLRLHHVAVSVMHNV